MHNRIHSLQHFVPHCPNIHEILNVGVTFRENFGICQTVRKVTLVEADQGGLRISLAQLLQDGWAYISGIACYQYFHVITDIVVIRSKARLKNGSNTPR